MAPGTLNSRQLTVRRKRAGRAPISAQRGPLLCACRGPGGPRERKLGEGTTGWTGSGKGCVPHPQPQAWAPRDGGGAGAGQALPFLFARLEPQRLQTSRPPEGLGRGKATGGEGYQEGSLLGGRPAAARELRSRRTRHRKSERTTTHNTGPRGPAIHPLAEAHTLVYRT